MATKRLPKKETNTPSSGIRQGSPSHWHQTGFLKKGSAKPAYAPLLLVLAGDIELNPGPECHKCKKPIGEDRPHFKCKLCRNITHKQQKCSGLSRYSRSQEWTCHAHGEHPEDPDPTYLSKRGDKCSVCNEPLRVGTPALQCTAKSCKQTCHKKQDCSTISRYSKEQWMCPTHSTSAKLTIAGRTVASLQRRTETKKVRTSCSICKRTIAKNTAPLVCSSCDGAFHKSCLTRSGHTRDEIEILCCLQEWKCDKCSSPPAPVPSTTSTLDDAIESSQPFQGEVKSSLKILQWNADGLSTKWPELNERLKKEQIDIALIQETKYKQKNKTPTFEGYAPIRYDREGDGGGLLCLIKHSIPYSEIPKGKQTVGIVESISFRVRIDKRKWLTISNVYMAPNRDNGEEVIYTDQSPASRSCFIAGDMNCHSALWDPKQPPDSRGERIEEWLSDSNLYCANDGSATRINRATGNESTPDVFLAPSQWLNRIQWTTNEDIGGSDHLPSTTTLLCKCKKMKPLERQPRWKKNADLSAFSELLEEKVDSTENNTIKRIKNFQEAVISAAKQTVPRTKPGKKTKSYLTPAIKTLIKQRNKLRRMVRTHRQEWIETCKKVR